MESEFFFVEHLIKTDLPDSTIFVENMTGTRDHLMITIISDSFKGKMLFEQHQMIMNLLKEELKNRIHAVKLKTMTYEKYKLEQQG